MTYIKETAKTDFAMPLKSNRNVALSLKEKQRVAGQRFRRSPVKSTLDLIYLKEVGSNSVNFMDCWVDEHSTFSPPGTDGKNAGLNPAHYRMAPRARIGYTVYLYQADVYNTNGYDGISKRPFADYNGYFKWYGEFELDPGIGQPPPDGYDR